MVNKKGDYKLPEDKIARIYYVGVFDYQKLVKEIAAWYADYGYEFHESVFKYKVPSPDGAEPEFKFQGWRKVTEYVMYWIYVKGHIWELKEVEVIIDGKKRKMAKGKIQLTFSMELELDYNNKFSSPAAAKIQDFLEKHVWYKQITGGWEDECYYRMYKLHKVVKDVLNMTCASNASDIRY